MLTSHFSYLQTCQLLFALLANSHCLSQAWEQTVSGIVPLSGSLDTIVSVPDCRIAQVFGHGAKWTVEAIHPQRSMASTAGAGLSGSSAFFSLLSRASVEFFVAPGHWKHFNGAVPRYTQFRINFSTLLKAYWTWHRFNWSTWPQNDFGFKLHSQSSLTPNDCN